MCGYYSNGNREWRCVLASRVENYIQETVLEEGEMTQSHQCNSLQYFGVLVSFHGLSLLYNIVPWPLCLSGVYTSLGLN